MRNAKFSVKIGISAILLCVLIFAITSCVGNDSKKEENIQSIGILPHVNNIQWGVSYDECVKQGIVGKELNEVSRERVYLSPLNYNPSFLGIHADEAYLGFSPQLETEINNILQMHHIKPFDNKLYFSKVYLYFNINIDELFADISAKATGIELVESIDGQYYRWESAEKVRDLSSYNEVCADIYNWLYASREQEKSINSMILYQHDDKNSALCIRGEEAVLVNYICSNI